MNEKKKPVIAIRADGNEVLGMGHLMRCMSIGKALEKQGAHCVFFVAQEKAGAFIRAQSALSWNTNTTHTLKLCVILQTNTVS